MDIKDFRYFLAVYEQRGFARAAQVLHTVQSNVTSRIRKLEEKLGARLFDRGADGASPTIEGNVLYGYAIRIVRLGETARAALTKVQQRGALRLGAMETTAAVRLPALLSPFHAACPAVDLSLITGPTSMLTQLVLAGELDGAFVAGPVPGDLFGQSPIFVERLCLVSSAAHPVAPTAEEMNGVTMIVFRTGCSYRQAFEIFLESSGTVAGRVMEFGSLDGILGCVASGMGVAVLPESVLASHRLSPMLARRPLPDGISVVGTYFVYLRSGVTHPFLETFLSHVRASATDLAAA